MDPRPSVSSHGGPRAAGTHLFLLCDSAVFNMQPPPHEIRWLLQLLPSIMNTFQPRRGGSGRSVLKVNISTSLLTART